MISSDFMKTAILVVGLENSGKSQCVSTISKNLDNETNENNKALVIPTAGISLKQCLLPKSSMEVICIEISGNPRYNKFHQQFIDQVKSILFCVDCTNFKMVGYSKEQFLKIIADYKDIPVCIALTKVDSSLESRVEADQIKKIFEISKNLKGRMYEIVDVDSKDWGSIDKLWDFFNRN